jgi:DNA polymerase I-like protein with 3'-5' exonuclease and polymerase domains
MQLEEMQKLSESEQAELFKRLDDIRKKGKSTNYSAMYGVGAPKLARELKVPVSEAKKLLEAYWKKNWAVKAYAENAKIKKVNGQEWVYNPVSKFWYSLRSRKDIWSTTNQSTGVLCFDSWIREFRKVRPQLTMQMHDEIGIEIKEGSRDKAEKLLRDAIDRVNEKLKLNVKLDISVQYGKSYADIH